MRGGSSKKEDMFSLFHRCLPLQKHKRISTVENGGGRDPPAHLISGGPQREGGWSSLSVHIPLLAPGPSHQTLPFSAFLAQGLPARNVGAAPRLWGWNRNRERQSRAGETASVCFEPSSPMFSECYLTILCGHLSFLSVSEVFLQFAFIVERFLLLSCHPV